jgi:opine dehydrogenase
MRKSNCVGIAVYITSETPKDRLPMSNRTVPVTILGAGNGGLALAGYLGEQGHQIALWNRSSERIAPVAALAGVQVSNPGSPARLGKIATVTSDISVALAEARRVIVAVPASAHADVAGLCARHLRDEQTVLLLPGRTGGALEFRRVLHRARCRARILLGEANTFPLAARTTGRASAVIHGTKSELIAAALPAPRTAELLAEWAPLLPMLRPAQSVLHTGLSNIGAILHPIISLLNAGRIRAGESFAFYAEGVTPRVAAVLEQADGERLDVACAFDVPACSLTEWVASAYGHRADNIESALRGNPAYAAIQAPTTLDHRYLHEDVPTGLIPLAELGRAAGLAMPTLRSLVSLGRAMLSGASWHRPRTLAALGLDGMTAAEIRRLVEGDATPRQQRVSPAAPMPMADVGSELALVPQI